MTTVKQTVTSLFAQADIQINGKRRGDILVHDESFYSNILAGGSLALGEMYMAGLWDCDALDIFMQKVLTAQLDKKVPINFTTIRHYLKSVLTNRQTRTRAWRVGQHHYDIGNDLYAAMLDKELMYSCGYWKDAKTLDDAQIAKLDLICRKLGLKKGDRVLDIGCGWGGMGRYAAKKYGVIYTGITVSKEQYNYANSLNAQIAQNANASPKHIKKREKFIATPRGVSNNDASCKFVLEDYRVFADKCKKEKIQFDAIISIGMFEHVGYKNYLTFMRTAHELLKDDGKFLLHTIGGIVSVKNTEPWIEKYIFPNSMLPSITQTAKSAEGLFVVEDLHNFGTYYDRTLMAWFANFDNAWPQLQKNNSKYDERFYRMWKYYLLVCAGSFRARKNQLWQFVLAKNPTQMYESIR